MKYTLALFLFAFIVATVQAASLGTNAERLARGLPPRSPTRLYKPSARDGEASYHTCVQTTP